MAISRRNFLSGLAAAGALSPLALKADGYRGHRPFVPHPSDLQAGPVFRHGVASGDPLADRVVLWTRVTPVKGARAAKVYWKIATDPLLQDVIASGREVTGGYRDYTVKVDPDGLLPDTTYYFQFIAHGESSPIGRTRTLPLGYAEQVRLGVASCSNIAFGFFAAYGHLARQEVNAVLHLGDYIYEYAEGEYGSGEAIGRQPFPDREILTLTDYRQRHGQHKSDINLQECHRQHPFICVWDDHETANDAYRDGAENHQEGEGSWAWRKAAALQAYFEWMPIRERKTRWRRAENIFRSFRFGNLAHLMMLETRLVARSRQVAPILDPLTGEFLLQDPTTELPPILAGLADPGRTLLGDTQRAWLFDELEQSHADAVQWRVIGQQTMLAQLKTFIPELANPQFDGFVPLNTDQWDGYEAERFAFLDFLEKTGIDNVCVLTGDIHSSWAQEVAKQPYVTDLPQYQPLAVEFVTPGITSPLLSEGPQATALENQLLQTLHHKFVNLSQKGYVVVDIDSARVQAEWYHMEDILNPVSGEVFAGGWMTPVGQARVLPAAGPSVAAACRTRAPDLDAHERWMIA